MYKPVLTYIAILLFTSAAYAQEVVTGLWTEPAINASWKNSDHRKSLTSADTIDLPFFDDFPYTSVYPDQAKWSDKYAYINNTYSVDQHSAGVATMDALDMTGRLYETASSAGFQGDMLTSQHIDLALSPADDIYLSFLYEAGGIADPPELKDSLTLQFWAPAELKWYSVWKSPVNAPDSFKAVIIRIDNSRYLKKGFRFRFINYASLSQGATDPSMAGNCDQWNLDYILLDKNRNGSDTLFSDVAFTKPVRTILKTYEAMPWLQFRQVFLSEMGPWITVKYRNNDDIVRNVTRTFTIQDIYKNTQVHSFSAGATNIDPLADVTYNANLIYTFNSTGTDSALFRIKAALTTDIFDPKHNDTIIYYQKFGSYFAFDDGSSEGGYGVNGLGSNNAMVAVKFKSFVADTLRAVQICFNDSYQNSNLRSFDLMVWKDADGIPGDIILTQEEMMVKQGTSNNGFYTYVLTDPVELTGSFFVGWKQRSETFLNAGFDINTAPAGRQYYWLNGNWNSSQAKGTIMIRPQFGPKISSTGIAPVKQKISSLRVWPNPATTILNIDPALQYDPALLQIRITDLSGMEILRQNINGQVDISNLKTGSYIIFVYSGNKPVAAGRFIKVR